MRLVSAKVGPFRSINEPQETIIDPEVTVLVGMNEAGKTVFLKGLHKAKDVLNKEKFNIIDDYPRKDFTTYKRRHEESPETAVSLTYELTDSQVANLNSTLNTNINKGFKFVVHHLYDNNRTISIDIPDKPALEKMAITPDLSSEVKSVLSNSNGIRVALSNLQSISDLNDADQLIIDSLKVRVEKADKSKGWDQICAYEAWKKLNESIPGFLYFSDYDLLPGKLNLKDLKNRIQAAKSDPTNAHKQVEPKHQAVLALLRMADVELDDFSNGTTTYEDLKSQIEAVSISLTDQVLEFWKQNENLEVEIDIRADAADAAPFNDGPNLYLRIKNRRHRGVSTPFDQRSRGFIWFFSFLVWFDSVQHQIGSAGTKDEQNLILLLDEPALALHALAQTDFLTYIDHLATNHQVIYTTHSPFMVNSDRLHQVRAVEDKEKIGTVISENLSGSDSKTIFPLQAALGWNIAQNLFIAKQNLLVEGVSELSILQAMSKIVEDNGGIGLLDNVSIVPVGGLSNVATFVSLLGGNGLSFAVLHDYSGKPDQKLDSMIQQKLLNKKSVFNFSQFRDLSAIGVNGCASDVEDLLEPSTYLEYFNKVFAKELNGVTITEAELASGERIVLQLEKYLITNKIKIRPSGGYNHYAVAAAFSTTPPSNVSVQTTQRFAALFKALNSSLK
ncbi:AAA family ATPase [Pseudomonas sp. dw_612]|uniref:AAA family ATPase n=1 Tax=Pseudomonas sp. dw_612 TaxID=2720080 RepID=UPI001BD3BDE0|nr:AAA family ATPase [Pseudomonas sp. dw_612]